MVRLCLFLVFEAVAYTALGGSRAWEARLNHEVTLQEPQDVPINAAGFAIVKNDTVENNSQLQKRLAKRYVAVTPGVGMQPSRLWPDKTISFCFDTKESRDAIWDALELAIDSWVSRGLSREVYKYREVVEPGRGCTGHKERSSILVISHNTDGILGTSVAMPALTPSKPKYKGPTMKLSNDNSVGQLNVVSNFAHELGHAWGLYHEHQNRKFWAPPFYGISGNDPDFAGKVFGKYFDCQALKDYVKVVGDIKAKLGSTPAADVAIRDICLRVGAADDWDFSASNWLPLAGGYSHTTGVEDTGAGYDSVDWDSIMLYPSGAGGIGTATPPTAPGADPAAYDRRRPVLRCNDGALITTNAIPSAGDVAGIRSIYESPTYAQNQGKGPVLPNDKKSSFFSSFMKDITKKKGKSCPK